MTKDQREQIINILYERCANGEITFDQRETMILKAREDCMNSYITENSSDTDSNDISILKYAKEKYDIFRESVYGLYNSGRITVEDMIGLLDKASDDFFNPEFITEKATREEYRLRDFKKRYKYDPQKKTIIVNGETYKVDLDIKNPNAKITVKNMDGEEVADIGRTFAIGLNSSDPTIVITNSFFKLKNSKRRDAVLQHEVGHSKMHSVVDSQHTDQRFRTEKNWDMFVKVNCDAIEEQYKAFGIQKPRKEIESEFINQLKSTGVTKETYLKNGVKDQEVIKQRNKLIEQAKKYCKAINGNSHLNSQEIEADRFAANKSGSSNLKKGLREFIKKDTKAELKNVEKITDKDTYKKAKSTVNKIMQDEYTARSKALKDDKLKNSKLLK